MGLMGLMGRMWFLKPRGWRRDRATLLFRAVGLLLKPCACQCSGRTGTQGPLIGVILKACGFCHDLVELAGIGGFQKGACFPGLVVFTQNQLGPLSQSLKTAGCRGPITSRKRP